MNETIYTRIIQAAKERKFLSYGDLSAAVGGSIADFNSILEEIADHEIANGRPLLVAIIVSEKGNMPGGGLFSYAKRKGLMKPKDKDHLTFFVQEAKRVHDFWENHEAMPKADS